ncbi:VOC family protein [Roseiarcaceae bacterium H3SJ34-1]|uniref:VOC family protein n=1 Tax=Terripilifer ovatus TaxID=3032367 RepID=UPI003AB922A9|nr:VOC family protein [Roseiarcaceae bacterium H3SJ34-1]
MAIVGVQSAIFGVDDLAACEKFFADFGLVVASRSADEIDYELTEGSHVVLRRSGDASLPKVFANGPGIRRVIWGVDTKEGLEAIETDLGRDRPVTRDADGTIYCEDDAGLPIGFRVFVRNRLVSDEEFTNVPGLTRRWNRHRKWFSRARPQLIHHVVFGFPQFDKAAAFYRNRLKFRVTDVARGRGIFLRADGRSDHHNIFWARTEKPTFMHISFGVENLDELLAGANNMQRQGWNSKLGLGRHRISSTIYFYIENPAGGEAEYSADTDCLDDNWQPRIWEPLFGNQHWVADLPAFLTVPPNEDVRLLADEMPELAKVNS